MEDLRKLITKLREDFTKGTLSETDVNKRPDLQFELWLQQAVDSKVEEFQAVNLATVSPQGKPSSRIVYLREFQNNNFFFYTNYNSVKAQHLVNNPNACLTFFWPQLERQIRIEGVVEKSTPEQADAYYNNRPYESKIGTWASDQSHKLSTREELEKKVEELHKQFTPETIKRPDFWGGYVLKANYYEFWQGRKSRLHDRICYELKNDNWKINRLSP
jgi:pyridoxamine 5'-phosphate oxidase